MGISNGISTSEQRQEAKDRQKAYQDSLERAAAKEAARTSDPRDFTDEHGNTWSYVVIDEVEVRIESCEAKSSKLVIPDLIEGKPVIALAADACAGFDEVEEVVCSDNVVMIGFCAFRNSANLRKAYLSRNLSNFDSGWFRNCRQLETLVMPGELEKIESRVFDLVALRNLKLGPGTKWIDPGAFAKSKLESIEVSEDNPFITTDGKAIYNQNNTALLALAIPMQEYTVREGCREILKKAFSGFSCLEKVNVPKSLEIICAFAFASTGITEFIAPPSLQHIHEKAFFNCGKLSTIILNEGLLSISSDVFTGTNISELKIPATVERLGYPIATRCPLRFSGHGSQFKVSEESPHFILDESGGLYRKTEKGICMERMLDPDAVFYQVMNGTYLVCEGAFFKHEHLQEVLLPDSLVEIESNAFKSCRFLVSINIPSKVTNIGDEAFLETNIEKLHLPASLKVIGEKALITYGAHHGSVEPSLHELTVDPKNVLFYTSSGCLIERKAGGAERVVLCTGSEDVVVIPETVDEIAPYAFKGLLNIRELYISEKIQNIGACGLAVDALIDLIHVDLGKPIEGHDFFEFRYPQTDRGVQQQNLALGLSRFIDVESLFTHYDNAIVDASSYGGSNLGGFDLYDQAYSIMNRLLDPIYLTTVNRELCDRILKRSIENICLSIAKRNDHHSIDMLCELGYINAENIYDVIESIGSLQDAEMTNYLLELIRERFGLKIHDYEL